MRLTTTFHPLTSLLGTLLLLAVAVGLPSHARQAAAQNPAPHQAAAATINPHRAGSNLQIVATTSYLADAARHLAPAAHITTLVGPGGDPHTYQASTRGIQRLLDADLVLWNGLGLEAQLDRQLRSLGTRGLAAAETLPRNKLLPIPTANAAAGSHGAATSYDPHVWNDPELWQMAVSAIAKKLSSIAPAQREQFYTNARNYKRSITKATQRATRYLAKVSEPRILITGHDAFSYLGRSFNLEVHATDFISTQAALGLSELTRLATLISREKVPTIFLDNQVNPQAIESLSEATAAHGWKVRVARSKLYADSLAARGEAASYTGALVHNAKAIMKGLANGANTAN